MNFLKVVNCVRITVNIDGKTHKSNLIEANKFAKTFSNIANNPKEVGFFKMTMGYGKTFYLFGENVSRAVYTVKYVKKLQFFWEDKNNS